MNETRSQTFVHRVATKTESQTNQSNQYLAVFNLKYIKKL